MKLSFINRKLYERLNDKQMFKVALKFSDASKPLSILENAYKWNVKDLVSLRKIKHKYCRDAGTNWCTINLLLLETFSLHRRVHLQHSVIPLGSTLSRVR